MLATFKKDASHLWKEIAGTWLLLGWLTSLDSQRAGYMPGLAEGWLNLLLPLAWTWLIARAVLEDPIPGERQFWLTLPQPRATLAAAKALFAAVFIHLPYLVSCCIVVGARGFSPVHFAPQLAGKQALLLLVLTLPSLALASISRHAMQYMVLAPALAGVMVTVAANNNVTRFPFQSMPWLKVDFVRNDLAVLMLALTAAAIVAVQYRVRATMFSRAVGVAGVAAAAALYLWLPTRLTAAMEAALQPLETREKVVLRRAPDREKYPGGPPRTPAIFAAVPAEIEGVPAERNDEMNQVAFEIDTPSGRRFVADIHPGMPSRDSAVATPLISSGFLFLRIDRSVYNQVSDEPVTLKGRFLLTKRTRANATSERTHCTASVLSGNLYDSDMLRTVCESPAALPRLQAVLTDTASGREWRNTMGTAVTNVPYPSNTWLSPVNRSDLYFHATAGDAEEPGQQWMIPESTLSHFRVEFVALEEAGKAVVDYELAGIDLRKYVTPAR
jgi:hypothetical protein